MKTFPETPRILLLCFIGAVISGFLLFHHVSVHTGFQQEPSFCVMGEMFDCDKVAKSSYSEFYGVPVASLGLLFYLTLLGFTTFCRPGGAVSEKAFSDVFFTIASLGLIPTLVLFALSGIEVGTFCLLCLVLDFVNLVLVVVAWRLPGRTRPVQKSISEGIKHLLHFIQFVFSPRTAVGQTKLYAQVSFLLFVTAAIVLYFSPSYIRENVIIPFEQQKYSVRMASDVVTQWKSAETVELDIVDSGSFLEKDFQLGVADAPVTIVTFSDFQCPHCKRASNEIKDLIAAHPGVFRLVFKNYPLDSACNSLIKGQGHAFACRAAQMARCAGVLGDQFFWFMHDALFELEEFTEESIAGLAQGIGIDTEDYKLCMEDPRALERITKDVEVGTGVVIKGTPAIFVNGKRLHQPLVSAIPKIAIAEGFIK